MIRKCDECHCSGECHDYLSMCRGEVLDGRKFPHEDFNILLQDWLKRIENILGQKAGEYAQGGDRLFNFRLAAKINGQTMAQALWGMATKHLVSVMDLVEGRVPPTPAMVNEKCTDLVNYIILLSAILLEEDVSDGRDQR